MKLSLVLPCYNEADVLPETIRRLSTLRDELVARGKISPESQIILVDDGSTDETWKIILAASVDDATLRGLKLSKNRGQEIALLAGLCHSGGDCAVSLDADLQDDLDAIEPMLDAAANGADIVFGVRSLRNVDTRFKRLTAEAYYRLLARLGVEIIFNHAHYRLMTRRALDALKQYEERNLFLRGIIPQLGFKHTIVYYERTERFAGESKYPLRKMLSVAWQGITSFSPAPLRAITIMGISISLLSFAIAAWALWIRFFSDDAVPGWASTVVPMYFLGGVQLLCIGVIGEYLGKIYLETKKRPLYFLEEDTATQANRAPRS